MQGYLYVEQTRGGDLKTASFSSRYFLSFPFCGLKWFREEPTDENKQRLLVDNSVGGWVYGGDIALLSCFIEAPTVRSEVLDSYIYPFVLEVSQRGEDRVQIRLASDEEGVRARWIEEAQKMVQTQNYLFACKECGAMPSSVIFFANDINRHTLHLRGVLLNSTTLGSLVMTTKLNEPDGSLLQQLSLENAQLADRHIPLVASFMSFVPYLEVLSLRDNYITCAGMRELSEALAFCSQLTTLNLSSNSIADKGSLALSASLSAMKRLRHFDISRNRLTESVTKSFALYLARHDSELMSISFAYNPMGDSIATLASLLLTNQPSKLEAADLSYCNIGEAGLDELSAAVPFCSTLKTLRINGNFSTAKATGRLIDAISRHFEKFGRFQVPYFKSFNSAFATGTGLVDRALSRQRRKMARQNFTLTIGGAKIAQDVSFLPKQVFKTAITNLSSNGVAGTVILRRRASLFDQDLSETMQSVKSTSRLKQRLAAMSHASSNSTSRSHIVCNNGIGCIRVKLSNHLSTVHDVVKEISRAVGAHPKQLVLLSASLSVDSKIGFILFTPLNATADMLKDKFRADCAWRAGMRSAFTDRALRQRMKHRMNSPNANHVDMNTVLPTSLQILQRFQDLCRIGDHKIRKMGIMSIFLFVPVLASDNMSGNGSKFTSVSFHVNASGGNGSSQVPSMPREVYDYLPSLYPAISYNDRFDDAADDGEEDGDTRRASRGPAGSRRRRGSASGNKGSIRRGESDMFEYDDDEEGRADDRHLDTFDDIFGLDSGPDAEGDAGIGATVEKAVLKDLDVRMVNAIAASHEEAGALDSDSAHFWEGVYGVPKWLKYTEAVILAPIQEEGIFKAVSMRKQLCDAMFKRDIDKISTISENMKKMSIPGGNALVLAESFLAELLTLKHASESLASLAQGPDDIHILEKFLLNCARLGYAGPETLAAVELREFLVRWAMNENAAEFESDLASIQRRAGLTNMMISRNMKDLKASIAKFNEMSATEALVAALEVKAAKVVIENENICSVNLRKATEAKSLKLIEDAIAEAAYHNMYDEAALRNAINILVELGGNSRGLFISINTSIREGSHEDLDKAIMEVRRVGWNHSALSSPVLTKILGLRNRIMQEEMAKARIIMVADSVSETGSVSNPAEVMQLLRRVRLLKLENDPILRDPLALLQSKMRHLTGIQHQEEAIIKLLEEKNVAKLSELLSGRGQGRLVMAAPTADVMNEWMDVLKEVCAVRVELPGTGGDAAHRVEYDDDNGFVDRATEIETSVRNNAVIKSGSLEKAARGNEGVLRNWRLRYFILQGNDISYFTKLGGEKKGTIRVTGGSVRLLTPSEASGHLNCIELQEGRDLSVIDPELLDEVRKQVNVFRRDQLEDELTQALSVGSEERLAAALEAASTYRVSLDGELMVQARSVLMRQQHKKLKMDLREALQTLPRRRLQELIRTAKRVRLDPNNYFLRKAILNADKSDVELTLLRSRASLHKVDDAVFKRSVASIQQLDAKRLSTREKYLLVAILLQWTGYTVLRNLVQGSIGEHHCIHVLNQVLASMLVYYIETEPMQLARTVLEGLKTWLEGTEIDNILNSSPTRPKLPSDRGISTNDLSQQFQGANTAITFSLERFPQLRRGIDGPSGSVGGSGKGGKGFFGFLGGSKKNLDTSSSGKLSGGEQTTAVSLSYTMDSLSVPLSNILKTLEPKVQELFEGLQVVMLDRPLAQFSASQAKSRNSLFSRADISSIASDLVSCGVADVGLRDELYLQLCKQLSKNPKDISRYYGWSIFSIYLNCFPPSFGLLPYLKTYVAESLVIESNQSKNSEHSSASHPRNHILRRRFSVSRSSSDRDETGEIALGTSKLISYSSKLLNNVERTYSRGLDSIVYLPEKKVLSDFLTGTMLEFEIVVMTGSVHRLSLLPSEIDSPLSVLYALFKQLVTGMASANQSEYGAYFAQSNSQADDKKSTSQGSSSITSTSVTDVLLKTFRGFALYRLDGDDGFHGALSLQRHQSLNDSAVFADVEDSDEVPDNYVSKLAAPAMQRTSSWSSNLLDFEVQPIEKQLVEWGEDILWELLVAGSDMGIKGSESRDEESSPVSSRRKSFASSVMMSPTSPGSADGGTYARESVRKRFVLRKRTALPTEVFSDQFQLFGDEASDQDIVTSKKLWSNWLTNGSSSRENSEGGLIEVSPNTPTPRRSSISSNNASNSRGKPPSGGFLPMDHVRVDLMFAEESRYVNSKTYIHSTPSQAYLIALQVVLSLCGDGDTDCSTLAKSWGSGQQSVLDRAGLSVRPCLQNRGNHAAADDNATSPINGDAASLENSDASSSQKRTHSILGPSKRISFSHGKPLILGEKSLSGNATPGKRQSELSRRESSSTAAGDLFSGPATTKPLSMDTITDNEKTMILEACADLGISVDEAEDLPLLVNWVGQLQAVAGSVGISILSPRFRYMIKRAYLGYLATFPLYGSHFFDAMFLGTHTDTTTSMKLNRSDTQLSEMIPIDMGRRHEDIDNNKKPVPVRVAINGEGVYLISAGAWESVFVAPLFDITGMSVLPPVRSEADDVFAEADELDIKFTSPLFSMNVNGMEVQLLSKSAMEIKKLVEAFSLEALSHGSFPHGTEGGNDVYEIGSSFVPASDQKELMNKFLQEFPLLPNPPAPPNLPKSAKYFSAPLSRRAILAEERAEEERRELELSKRAAESHVAKHMARLETGRQALNKIMAEEDEEEEDDYIDMTDPALAKENKVLKERSRAAKEDIERVRQARVAAALSGVSDKQSNLTIDIVEPFSSRGGMLSPGDSHYDRGKFHAPPLLKDLAAKARKDREEAEGKSSVHSPTALSWPSDVKLLPPPKQFTKVTFSKNHQWPVSATIFARNEETIAAEMQNAMQWINGMHYEHSEYLSKSMAVVASRADDEDYDFSEEGAFSTAISMTHPVQVVGAPTRRGSTNTAYSTLMRRNSAGVVVPGVGEDGLPESALAADEDGNSLPIVLNDNVTRKPSFIANGIQTFETFDSTEGNHADKIVDVLGESHDEHDNY